MQSNPLVSLILFTYNQENYIEEAIIGALAQTYSPLEIVISDDFSNDNTFQIIQKCVNNYSGPHRIILNKNEKNIGLVNHVNYLFYEKTNGEFVVVSAGDDISLPNRVEKSINFMLKNPDVVALSSSLLNIDENSNQVAIQSDDLKEDIIYDINYYLSDSFKHINGASRIVRRSLINAFPKLNSECPTEDTTFLLRAFLHGKVALLKEKLVHYRIHSNNLSSSDGLKKMKIENIFNQYYDDLYFHFNKNFDEHSFIQLLNKIEKLKIKRLGILDSNKPVFKRLLNKVLRKVIKGHSLLVSAWYEGDKRFNELLSNIFKSKFPSKETIKLGGSTWSKNYGDALNVPLLNGLYGSNYFESFFTSSKKNEELFMIGSIIHRSKKDTIIWGSGCINSDFKIKNKPKKVYAVRGPLTRNVLIENGIECPEIYGDPALLLPLLYNPKVIKKYKFGILPHYVDVNHKTVRKFKERDDVLFINIQVGYQNWENLIDQINQCEFILTSSLHGVILSDVYNVPNLWVKFSEGVFGNGFKFQDYFGSVSKSVPSPFDLNHMVTDDILFKELSKWQPIKFDNKPLLDSFPYGSLLAKFN